MNKLSLSILAILIPLTYLRAQDHDQAPPSSPMKIQIHNALPPSLLSDKFFAETKFHELALEPSQFPNGALMIEASPGFTYVLLHQGKWRVFTRRNVVDPFVLMDDATVDEHNSKTKSTFSSKFPDEFEVLERLNLSKWSNIYMNLIVSAVLNRASLNERRLRVLSLDAEPTQRQYPAIHNALTIDHEGISAAASRAHPIDMDLVIDEFKKHGDQRTLPIHERPPVADFGRFVRWAPQAALRETSRLSGTLLAPTVFALGGSQWLSNITHLYTNDPEVQANPKLSALLALTGAGLAMKAEERLLGDRVLPEPKPFLGSMSHLRAAARVAAGALGASAATYACKYALMALHAAAQFTLPK